MGKNYRYRFLSKEDFHKKLEDQNNRCEICGDEFTSTSKAFIDHNHSTDRARGLLCSLCNSAVGNSLENIETLKNLIKYLELNDS